MIKKIGLYNFEDTNKFKSYFTNQTIEFEKVENIAKIDNFDLVITNDCIEQIGDKIINIHPALLPAYPNKNAILNAFSDGVKVSGITIHTKYKIIAQYPILIGIETHIDDFMNEINEIEKVLMPAVIDSIINDRVFDFKDLFSNPCHNGGCSNCKGCH